MDLLIGIAHTVESKKNKNAPPVRVLLEHHRVDLRLYLLPRPEVAEVKTREDLLFIGGVWNFRCIVRA